MLPEIPYQKVNTNTFKLEKGVNPFGTLESFTKISGVDFDGSLDDIFSLTSKQEAFGENFIEKNIIQVEQLDGTFVDIEIPSILCGGMGIGISTPSLIESMNKLGFGGHLSSIGISIDGKPFLYKKGNINFKESEEEIKNTFYELFEKQLGLTKEEINKHFLRSEDIATPEGEINYYTVRSRNAITFRMKDLISIYSQIINLKKTDNNVGINCMYKSSSYLAAIKVASLAGIDFITTGAGMPSKKPNIIVKEFLEDIGKTDIRIPAFGLITSSARAYQEGYDYYIIEDANEAGGHEGLTEKSMGKSASRKFTILQRLKKKIGKDIPIYIAGGIGTREDIKESFDNGALGVQLGTNLAVSDEAVEGNGVSFKENLISGNHLGDPTTIDEIYKNEARKSEREFIKASKRYKNEILKLLDIELESFEDLFFEMSITNNIYFNGNVYENLNETYQNIYNEIILKMNERLDSDKNFQNLIRKYGNTLKAIKAFKKSRKNGDNHTHLLFDSTVGFNGRKRIAKSDNAMLNEHIKSKTCVECIVSCLLSKRGNVKEGKANAFCIRDWLDKVTGDTDKQLDFSGTTTVFYPEIRKIKDIMGAYLGYYVER